MRHRSFLRIRSIMTVALMVMIGAILSWSVVYADSSYSINGKTVYATMVADDTAFSGISNLTIHGVKGRAAETYAHQHGFAFEAE